MVKGFAAAAPTLTVTGAWKVTQWRTSFLPISTWSAWRSVELVTVEGKPVPSSWILRASSKPPASFTVLPFTVKVVRSSAGSVLVTTMFGRAFLISRMPSNHMS